MEIKSKNGKPLKERILETSAKLAYRSLINMKPSVRPKKIYLTGANQTDKIVFMNKLLNEKFKYHRIAAFTDEVNGGYEVEVFGDLDNLAFLCKEDFYSQPRENRRRSIVVNGGSYKDRERFVKKLRPLVDVFVLTQDQFEDSVGEYVIDLDDYY